MAPAKGRRDEPFGVRLSFRSAGPHQVVGAPSEVDEFGPVADFGELLELAGRQLLPRFAKLDGRGGGFGGGSRAYCAVTADSV